MADQRPFFELHIRPMFRLLDRAHMAWSLDLANYEEVRAHADVIARFLRRPPPQTMPTVDTGGPWPEGWIAVFEQWVDADCPRLEVTAGVYAAQRIGNGNIIVSVDVDLDNGAAAAWPELEASAADVAEYTLYLRPAPDGVKEPPRQTKSREVITDNSVTSIYINDADGRQSIPIDS